MKKNKSILIIMLIVIEIVATYFMYKSSTNKEIVLDNVELKEIKKDGSFAIMVETKEGSGEYQEYSSSTTWPSGYNFNQSKSSCINEKGEIVSGVLTFEKSENKAYVTNTKQTTYCYLYFDLPITETLPTCSFSVSNTNGSISITFNKSDNAKKWYVGTSGITPQIDSQYNNTETTTFSFSTLYGYVKNSVGIASCTIETKISQTSGCHSATAGGSSSGGDSGSTCTLYEGYCSCVNGTMSATITSSSQVYSCSGHSTTSNCSGSCNTAGGTSQRTDYETCSCSSSGGPSAGSTVWTCQYDTRTPYSSQSACDAVCKPVAGTCDVGYTRLVVGTDGQANSQALCYKTFSSVVQ